MTKLREQMIQDMVRRGFAPSTQRAYLQAMTKFARHYNRSPDQIANEELEAYFLHLHLEEKRATSTCNVASAALRILYHKTLGRPQTGFDVPIARAPSKIPHVLIRDEVARLLTSTSFIKHRALFLTTYSAGLRVSEVVRLRPTDVDSGRMLIRVEQGKGSKDRLTLLSPQLLEALRDYWRRTQPGERPSVDDNPFRATCQYRSSALRPGGAEYPRSARMRGESVPRTPGPGAPSLDSRPRWRVHGMSAPVVRGGPTPLMRRGCGNRSANRHNLLQRTSARERPTDPRRAPSPVDSRNPIRPKPHDSA